MHPVPEAEEGDASAGAGAGGGQGAGEGSGTGEGEEAGEGAARHDGTGTAAARRRAASAGYAPPWGVGGVQWDAAARRDPKRSAAAVHESLCRKLDLVRRCRLTLSTHVESA